MECRGYTLYYIRIYKNKSSYHNNLCRNGKGIQDVEDKFALNNDPENPPAKGSAVWGDSPITPTAQDKYLWKYEIIHYTTGDSKETTPTVISMYSAPGEEGAPGLSAAAVFLYQRATSASSITKPTETLTYTFATGTLSGQLGDWKQSIPASNGNPCFVIQATAIGTGETDTISPSEWSTITELVSDGKMVQTVKMAKQALELKQLPSSMLFPTMVFSFLNRVGRRTSQKLLKVSSYGQGQPLSIQITHLPYLIL